MAVKDRLPDLAVVTVTYRDYVPDEPEVPVRRAPAAPKPQPASGPQGALQSAILQNKAFHDTRRAEIQDVRRTNEGQELLAQIVKKELDTQREQKRAAER